MRAATGVYSLSSGKGMSAWHKGQLSLSGMAAPCLLFARLMRALIHALGRANDLKRRERTRPRVDARNAFAMRTRQCCVQMALIKVHGEVLLDARTVCLMARRRLREESADVLPVRQRNSSKIDYCWFPRREPRL